MLMFCPLVSPLFCLKFSAAAVVMDSDQDDELVRLLVAELDRNGGAAVASEILLYDRKLRVLLGDRKLLRFLLQYPKLFAMHELSGSARRVVLVDGWQAALGF